MHTGREATSRRAGSGVLEQHGSTRVTPVPWEHRDGLEK
jgi:hypothetical protein